MFYTIQGNWNQLPDFTQNFSRLPWKPINLSPHYYPKVLSSLCLALLHFSSQISQPATARARGIICFSIPIQLSLSLSLSLYIYIYPFSYFFMLSQCLIRIRFPVFFSSGCFGFEFSKIEFTIVYSIIVSPKSLFYRK